MTHKSNKRFALAFKFGVLGLFGLLLGFFAAQVGYQGYESEAFSPLNHTISELGNYGHSALAVVLNGGLFFGGLSMAMWSLLSLSAMKDYFEKLVFFVIAVTFVSLATTGLFPLNVYHLHIVALSGFFYGGCVSSALFIIYIAAREQTRYPRWLIIPALLTLLSLSSFLFIPHLELGVESISRPFYQELVVKLPRQTIWWPAVLEWLSLCLFLGWNSCMLRYVKPSERDPCTR
ncbi:DUF998 domain-containing protein [Shewanella gelidii]|uniref:DUF998 domain-containing protein n=1 Tax=Shewanella gelidii TaxID=1642821 RepID=A0A917N739_9GAMM|nr:DUF998 domain-containing protein [Shewanella gelidii]MCL1097171.1 DUF998 domain-containing protein [Shewanella gelidii]GGI73027.1 DUF998 domain-containing protein [Shewanella gelidii]